MLTWLLCISIPERIIALRIAVVEVAVVRVSNALDWVDTQWKAEANGQGGRNEEQNKAEKSYFLNIKITKMETFEIKISLSKLNQHGKQYLFSKYFKGTFWILQLATKQAHK